MKAVKKQKFLRQKMLKLQLRSLKRCKVTLTTTIRQLRSKGKPRHVQIGRVLKKASVTLQPRQTKTVNVKFTKKSLKAITKALRAHKKLQAAVVVLEKDAASKATRRTLKMTIRS